MDGGADISVTVRLAQKLAEDVEVEIGFTPEIIAGYNANNGTEYEALPAEQLPQGLRLLFLPVKLVPLSSYILTTSPQMVLLMPFP